MSKLSDKIRASREGRIEIDGVTYKFLRPCQLDIVELQAKARTAQFRPIDNLRFVFGWEGMTEARLGIPGGDPHPLDWDPEAFVEFVSDRADVFEQITRAIFEAYEAHAAEAEAARKN